MKAEVLKIYRRLRANPVSCLVGRDAEMSLRDARTIARFKELERAGKVRISSEDEQENYFDVYGKPDSEKERKAMVDTLDRLGCVYVFTEYLTEAGEWEQADSIGMCVYENPESPFENCYVSELMREAIDKAEAEEREPAERAYWESRDVETI